MKFAIFIAVVLISSVVGMEFEGTDTPTTDMKKFFAPAAIAEVMQGIMAAGAEIPKDMGTLSSLASGFHKAAEQKEKEEPKSIVPPPKQKTPEEKYKVNLKNAYKTIELEKLQPTKSATKNPEIKALSPEKQALAELAQEVGATIPQQKTEKAALIQCKQGDCCDLSTGMFKVSGTICFSGPCEEASQCLGSSNICPPTTQHKPDGTPCQDGSCKKGICVVGNPTTVQKAEIEAKKEVEKEKAKTDSYVYPRIPEAAYPQGSFESEQKGHCANGGCCDLATFKFKPRGTPCAPVSLECQDAAGMCNGFTSVCPLKAKPDGSVCKGGKCILGECVAFNPVSSKETPAAKIVGNSKPKQAQPAPVVYDFDRKAEIERLKREKNKLTDMIMVKGILGFVKNKHEENKQLAKRAIFPYKLKARQTEESPENTFSVHEYVRQMTNKKKEEATKQASDLAAANLKSSNASSSSSGISTTTWAWIIGGSAFVVIIVAVVVLSSSKSPKQRNQKKLNDEYDKI